MEHFYVQFLVILAEISCGLKDRQTNGGIETNALPLCQTATSTTVSKYRRQYNLLTLTSDMASFFIHTFFPSQPIFWLSTENK